MSAALDLQTAAMGCAAGGFHVFPIAAKAKAPPIKAWQTWATNDPTKIRQHWGIAPLDNIGIACGNGLLVLDVDGEEGKASLAQLELMHGKLPNTRTTSTPSGGRHYYFNGPDVSNSAGIIAPGLDIRSRGGYVVGPGSVTPKGRYAVINTAGVAVAPQWLIDLCSAPRAKANDGAPVPDAPTSLIERAADWLKDHPGAVEGKAGDAHTFSTACSLRDFKLSEQQTLDLLAGEWNERCSPPWPVADLQVKVANAYRYAGSEAGSKVALPEDFDLMPETVAAITKAAKPRPKGGTLQDIASRISSSAYLVKGLLRQKSHAVMYGAPGQGKSFLALDIAYHVATGREWFGKRVSKGPVVYLAFEGLGGMPARAEALLRHYGNVPMPLRIEPSDWNLRDKAGREALSARIAEIQAEDFACTPPALIIVDTLARSMRGGDENSAQDMGAVNDAVGGLIDQTGACVLLIHHSGKNKAAGARGSSALLGAVDTELEVDGGQVVATKQRDVQAGAPIGFKLTPVALDVDEDGDTLTSCVVEAGQAATARARLAGNAARAFSVLCSLSPDNAPVSEADWKKACNEFLPEKSARQSWFDIKRKLQQGSYVNCENGMVVRTMEGPN